MTLDLEPEEAAVLRRVLTTFLSDLRMEIVDTEDYDMREALKGDEEIIKRIIRSLEGSDVKAA